MSKFTVCFMKIFPGEHKYGGAAVNREIKRMLGNVSACLCLIAAILLFSGCGEENPEPKLSVKAYSALRWVNTLPPEQRDILLGRSPGTEADRFNAMANLINSGHEEGLAEYLEVTSGE